MDPPATAPLDLIKRLIVMQVETVLFLNVTRSLQLPRLPPQQRQQQQPLQQLQLLLLNVFQTVIWIALVSVAWLSVTHLIAVVLVEVDLLLRVSTFPTHTINVNYWSIVKMVLALDLMVF